MKTYLLYPFDTGCLYRFDFKGTKIKSKIFDLGEIKYRVVVFKFGTGIVEVETEINTTDIREIKKLKLSKRKDIDDFCKKIANMTIGMLEKDIINKYPERYEKDFIYPVFVNEQYKITPAYAYINNEEILDIIEYALAQYWNLLSFDYILNHSIVEDSNLLSKFKMTINIFKLLKDYQIFTKQALENYLDSTEVIQSITNVMEEIPDTYNPTLLEYYEQARKTLRIDELIQRVLAKLQHNKELFSFVRENLTNWLFFIIEITFILWFIFDIIVFLTKK